MFFTFDILAQKPIVCAGISQRSNSNGGSNSCPNVNGTSYASNFAGTTFAMIPGSAKTGNLQLNYPGANASLLPYAITGVWLTTTGTVQQSVLFGPAGTPTINGLNTQVSYCFYGTNLPTSGTLSFQLTDPQTGTTWGICSYDASCDSNCLVVANPVVILPVVFTDFEAVAGPGPIERLKWTTAQETNNKGFDIQRSEMDSTFHSIGFVPSANPAGSSTLSTGYEFIDPEIARITKASYRIRQVDLDGESVYSSVVSVPFNNGSPDIKVYSMGDILAISIPPSTGAPGADAAIYDTQGKMIRRQRLATSGDLKVTGLPHQCLYFVVVEPNDGTKKTSVGVYIR